MVVIQLLDPTNKLFGNRIISRDRLRPPHYLKDLTLIQFPASRIVIVDDSVSVWPRDTNNLIAICKYNFFQNVSAGNGNGNGDSDSLCLHHLSEIPEPERANGGPLASLLNFLISIHDAFFFQYKGITTTTTGGSSDKMETLNLPPHKDVRLIIQWLKQEDGGGGKDKKFRVVAAAPPARSGVLSDDDQVLITASHKQCEKRKYAGNENRSPLKHVKAAVTTSSPDITRRHNSLPGVPSPANPSLPSFKMCV
ncbi:hypothetical protein KP509_13G045100 [Ceratopteris richardii]|uniref:protein-serine/threonine phosphatase n=1 Tax=Ceratopteris richardii TaxID=49495 RepID=A0A8T2TFE3_CERRI|nr:hypothetical protein KP509_13G045100 [Ceratopteris richardii]